MFQARKGVAEGEAAGGVREAGADAEEGGEGGEGGNWWQEEEGGEGGEDGGGGRPINSYDWRRWSKHASIVAFEGELATLHLRAGA